jgi:hypothetical protein
MLRDDVRWKFGVPPVGNANYAWIQHFIHHLAPPNGRGGGIAGFVMANGSLSTNSGGEGEIRRNIIEADLVDCIIAMPTQLFLTTGIPVSLWFVSRDTDERALSAAETTAMWYRAAKGVVLIGSRTGGANGYISRFYAPGGIIIPFTGSDVRNPDGKQLQRIGVIPDIEVYPTIAGIRAGRDELLERAINYLEQGR